MKNIILFFTAMLSSLCWAVSPWNSSIQYKLDDFVSYDEGLYLSLQESINEEPGISDAWLLINEDQGISPFVISNTYQVGEKVTYDSNVYMAVRVTTGKIPGSSSSWVQVVDATILAPSIGKMKTDIILDADVSIITSQPISYRWKMQDKPEGAKITWFDRNAKKTRFKSNTRGAHKLKLTMTAGTQSYTTTKEILIDRDGDGLIGGDDPDRDGDYIVDDQDLFPLIKKEWRDDNFNDIGNYADGDEDGDGVKDIIDDYPLDPNATTSIIVEEQEFNDNIINANLLGGDLPIEVVGVMSPVAPGSDLDADYYSFEAKEGDAISFLIRETGSLFEAEFSVVADDGLPIPLIQQEEDSKLISLYGTKILSDGTYTLIVYSQSLNQNINSTYSVSIFYDSDLDGISDSMEIALGLNEYIADMDNDGILDGFEAIRKDLDPDGDINGLDVDRDGIPNWWDWDSDGDFISDAQEGISDEDRDGIPAFLDADSDNYSLDDMWATYFDTIKAFDSDFDSIPDYRDADDDNDGLNDEIDPEPTISLYEYSSYGLANNVSIAEIETEFNTGLGIELSKYLAYAGTDLKIKGENLGSINHILFLRDGEFIGVYSIENNTENELTFRLPPDLIADQFILTDGYSSTPITDLFVRKDGHPVVYLVDDDGVYLTPGSYHIFRGKNLVRADTVVNIGGVPIQVDKGRVLDSAIFVGLPSDIDSGELSFENNTVVLIPELIFGESIQSGNVVFPNNTQVSFDDLYISSNPYSKVNVNESGQFSSVNVALGEPKSIFAMTKEESTFGGNIFMTGLHIPGQNNVEISSLSTAAETIYSMLGLSSISDDDMGHAIELIIENSQELAVYIENALSSHTNLMDVMALDEFKELQNSAYIASEIAIRHAVDGGYIKLKNHDSTGSISMSADTQYDISVSIADRLGPATSRVEISNDTMLFLDRKFEALGTNKIILDYANSLLVPHLIGPQKGFWGAYQSSSTLLDLRGSSMAVTIKTPGFVDVESSSQYFGSPSGKLLIRTLTNQVFLPAFSSVGIVGLNKPKVDKVLNLLISIGAVEAFENYMVTGDMEKTKKILVEKITQEVFISELVGILLSKSASADERKGMSQKLLKRFTGFASVVIDVAPTVSDLGKTLYDLITTPHELKFEINMLGDMIVSPDSFWLNEDVKYYPISVGDPNRNLGPVSNHLTSGSPRLNLVDKNGSEYIAYYSDTEVSNGLDTHHFSIEKSDVVNATSPFRVFYERAMLNSHGTVEYEVIDTKHNIEILANVTLESILPYSVRVGEAVSLEGVGFSSKVYENRVFFRSLDGYVEGEVVKIDGLLMTAIVPEGAISGSVYFSAFKESEWHDSNKKEISIISELPFVFKVEDDAFKDDLFALYIDDKHFGSMSDPEIPLEVGVRLNEGFHKVSLRGIDAPDDLGTYLITMPIGVNILDGPSTSGSDLLAGMVKTWRIYVDYDPMVNEGTD